MAETRELVRRVLDGAPALDARSAWDSVWREILSLVLEGRPVPQGTVHDMIPEVQRYLADNHTTQALLDERCASYLRSNRGPSLAFSELWCEATFRDGRRVCFHKASKGSPRHAEVQALEHLSDLQDGSRLQSVEVYMNVSPCSECAGAILRFLAAQPGVRTGVYFSSLFAHHGDNHRQGLRALHAAGVKLAVFDRSHWAALARWVQHEEEQQATSATVTNNTKVRGFKRKLDADEQIPTQRRRPN